jgi:hypothetical protein
MTSPFIEGSNYQWAWDSTSLGWLKECPRKYQYHMIEGWVSKGEQIHLEYGILYHEALAEYEKLLFEACGDRERTANDHEQAVHLVVYDILERTWRDGKPWRAIADLEPNDKASLKNRENLVRTVVWYLDKFKNDPAQTRMHPVTGKPMIELHFQFNIGAGLNPDNPYVLCGHLDRVVEFQGESFVMDRKTTTSTLGSYYFEQYDPDNQMSLYTVASQVAFKTPVKGVIIDAAQIAVGFSRFVRSFVFKTQDQIDEWMKDLRFWLWQASIFADRKYWPQNDKSCHKFGGCVFREICSRSPSVRDKFLESNFTRREWNPLIPRE